MESQTTKLLKLWTEARTRFTNQLVNLTDGDMKKRLAPATNSAGFLIRHIGDVELLFARNVFGATEIKVSAKTVIDKRDTGEWTNCAELLNYVEEAGHVLHAIIEKQAYDEWDALIETKEFGTKTKAEALGRIVSHTAYHAGQLALILKYGS